MQKEICVLVTVCSHVVVTSGVFTVYQLGQGGCWEFRLFHFSISEVVLFSKFYVQHISTVHAHNPRTITRAIIFYLSGHAAPA